MARRSFTTRPKHTPLDHARWALSVGLLVGLLWMVNQSTRGEGSQVCSEELLGSADPRTVELCRPVEATDPSVIIGLLVALSPLAPDVAKLQLGGLLTLERRVEEAEQAQKELAGQVQALDIKQSIRQEQHTHYHGAADASPHVQFEIVGETVEEKKEEFLDDSETGEGR